MCYVVLFLFLFYCMVHTAIEDLDLDLAVSGLNTSLLASCNTYVTGNIADLYLS